MVQKKLKILFWTLGRLTSRFHWSIANSQITAESVRPYVGERLTVIYNGIKLTQTGNGNKRLRDLVGLSEHSRIVGLVGSLSPIKGHLHFIEAASQVCAAYNDVHFVYIGGQSAAGQQEYLDQLLAKREELALEERVHFLGHRPDAFELTADFDIATVCTLPPGEGFGNVIVEAMAQSVPVISTDEGAAREIITEGKTGILIPAADSKALAEAIKGLLDNDEKRKSIGSQGYLECLKRFDIQKTVEQVENIYKKVLNLDVKERMVENK